MKAITGRQPEPSLLTMSVQTILTRSWPCPPALIDQRLAIHAAAKLYDRDTVERFSVIFGARWPALPLGAVVGSGIVTASLPIVGQHAMQEAPYVRNLEDGRGLILRTTDEEDGGSPTDISDQLPYGDFTPARWAWIIEQAAPSTDRCPWCWGRRDGAEQTSNNPPTDGVICCPACDGTGHCDPIPARGRQRTWDWTP